jgi:hypothetical protein
MVIFLPNKTKEGKFDRVCSKYDRVRNVYKTLVGKLEGKRPSENLDIDKKVLKWILSK